ncbi:hypothetical protein [Photobacterium sp. 1_MG-2023]|uniref:hypothetical protein n=1 Tax=Photobacterium sp. 1_MG-2023 TaxID=3062646 RepID=UPI0026E264F4|nr:hypothetical protein [Photobacterium sp. 1_MG-2023]MDO6708126.1 hypothetical protein [Photobacterium sp. 1_MG-2023]
MKRFFSNYIYIIIPFLALMITKFLILKPEDIILATDWSVASFMIFAQCMNLLITDNIHNKNISKLGVAIYIGISVSLLIICLGVYVYVTVYQNFLGGILQIITFILSSIWMMSVYKANDYIEKTNK